MSEIDAVIAVGTNLQDAYKKAVMQARFEGMADGAYDEDSVAFTNGVERCPKGQAAFNAGGMECLNVFLLDSAVNLCKIDGPARGVAIDSQRFLMYFMVG